jgi:hypothetical protein
MWVGGPTILVRKRRFHSDSIIGARDDIGGKLGWLAMLNLLMAVTNCWKEESRA